MDALDVRDPELLLLTIFGQFPQSLRDRALEAFAGQHSLVQVDRVEPQSCLPGRLECALGLAVSAEERADGVVACGFDVLDGAQRVEFGRGQAVELLGRGEFCAQFLEDCEQLVLVVCTVSRAQVGVEDLVEDRPLVEGTVTIVKLFLPSQAVYFCPDEVVDSHSDLLDCICFVLRELVQQIAD